MTKKPKRRSTAKPAPKKVIDLVDAIRGQCFGGISVGESISNALLKFGGMNLWPIEWECGDAVVPGGWFTFGEVEYTFLADGAGNLECYSISIKPWSGKPHYLHNGKFFYTDTHGIKCEQKHEKTIKILRELGFDPVLLRYAPGVVVVYRFSENVHIVFGYTGADDNDAPMEQSTFAGFWIIDES